MLKMQRRAAQMQRWHAQNAETTCSKCRDHVLKLQRCRAQKCGDLVLKMQRCRAQNADVLKMQTSCSLRCRYVMLNQNRDMLKIQTS